MLKPVLAEVEQDTNEETPLVSEATFAEEIADATAPARGRGRQGSSPCCIDRFDCDGGIAPAAGNPDLGMIV